MRRLNLFSGSSLQATYGYQLALSSYGTVYACPYEGSKVFTVLVFVLEGVQIQHNGN